MRWVTWGRRSARRRGKRAEPLGETGNPDGQTGRGQAPRSKRSAGISVLQPQGCTATFLKGKFWGRGDGRANL